MPVASGRSQKQTQKIWKKTKMQDKSVQTCSWRRDCNMMAKNSGTQWQKRATWLWGQIGTMAQFWLSRHDMRLCPTKSLDLLDLREQQVQTVFNGQESFLLTVQKLGILSVKNQQMTELWSNEEFMCAVKLALSISVMHQKTMVTVVLWPALSQSNGNIGEEHQQCITPEWTCESHCKNSLAASAGTERGNADKGSPLPPVTGCQGSHCPVCVPIFGPKSNKISQIWQPESSQTCGLVQWVLQQVIKMDMGSSTMRKCKSRFLWRIGSLNWPGFLPEVMMATSEVSMNFAQNCVLCFPRRCLTTFN